jgi:hypothetical protein
MFRKVDAHTDIPREGARNTLVRHLTGATTEEAAMGIPGPDQRWRCAGCGNLTRFDVVRSRRTVEYWHVDLAGDAVVEDAEVREDTVESVTCRWCGRADAVELVARNVSAEAR